MPVDPKTGKEYPYTEKGIAQHKKDTGEMPFKLKSGNGPLPFKQMGASPVKQSASFGKQEGKLKKTGKKKVKRDLSKEDVDKIIKSMVSPQYKSWAKGTEKKLSPLTPQASVRSTKGTRPPYKKPVGPRAN